jgi:murein DD-endopeptidase MepM/ murein hydrolase activator NlpD
MGAGAISGFLSNLFSPGSNQRDQGKNNFLTLLFVVVVVILFLLLGGFGFSNNPVELTNKTLAPELFKQPGVSEGSTIACQVGAGECRWPVRGCITQGPNGSFSHQGTQAIDISANLGTDVGATYDGVVNIVITGFGPTERTTYRSFGNAVYIQHTAIINGQSRSFTGIYAHLATVSVRRGDTVTQGQKIGTVGSSGYSTGPHLHYQTSIPINSVLPSVVPQCNNIGECTRSMGASRCF